ASGTSWLPAPAGQLSVVIRRPRVTAGPRGAQAMRTGQRRSYAEIDHWRKYQPFLPERMRLSAGREPAEEWWPWRGADVHLDRYAAPAAPLTVVLLHGAGGYGRLLAPHGLLLQAHGYEVVMLDLP